MYAHLLFVVVDVWGVTFGCVAFGCVLCASPRSLSHPFPALCYIFCNGTRLGSVPGPRYTLAP